MNNNQVDTKFAATTRQIGQLTSETYRRVTQGLSQISRSVVNFIVQEDSSDSEHRFCDSECSQCASDLRSIQMASSGGTPSKDSQGSKSSQKSRRTG